MLNNCEAKGLGCVLTLPIYRGREQHGNGREAGDKGTGSGRVRYGRREVLTPLSPPHKEHLNNTQRDVAISLPAELSRNSRVSRCCNCVPLHQLGI